MKAVVRGAVRIFWGTLLFGVIAMAVLVQLGRAIFPVLDDYRSLVEDHLSQRLQVAIDVGSIEAKWDGLRPQLHLFDVEVQNISGEPIFEVRQVDLEVGLLSTLRDWRLAFRTLTFTGLEATLQQRQNGRWYVRGLESLTDASEDKLSINDPLDIFLFGRRVEMLDTALGFHFRSGLVSDIAIPVIRLENDEDFHRLAAEFSIDNGAQALALVVEGRGDPRDPAQFDAEGYLNLSNFPSEKVLAAVGIGSDVLLADDERSEAPANWRNTGQVDLRLWFQGTGAKGLQWRGDLGVSGVPVIPPPGMRWPESLQSNFAGQWHPEAGWFVDMVGADLRWPQFAAPALNARLRGKLGEPSQLHIQQLDIAAWREVTERAGLLPEAVSPMLRELAPFGQLRNAVLARTRPETGYFTLKANVAGGGVEAWKGVPAVEGVDGYIEATAFAGRLIISSSDGVRLDFPSLYRQPLELDYTSGDLRWQVNRAEQLLAISSGTLRVSNDDIAATGHLNLRLPLVPAPGIEPELTLTIGVREGAANLHRLLVPYTVPDSLYKWLNDSIRGGVVSNAGLIYHGSLSKKPEQVRVIQLSAAVREGELVFDPSWPALTDASATIVLDDSNFKVVNLQGEMAGVNIDNVQVGLKEQRGGKGRAIELKGDVNGESGDALKLLQSSPVKDILGDQLASWQLSGRFDGRLGLLVPLQPGVEGAKQSIKLNLVDNELYIPQLNLRFSELSGPFSYSDKKGVASDHLSARLWGQAVQGRLSSRWADDDKRVQLDFAGQLDVGRLRQWSERPELGFAAGVTAVSGRVDVPVGQDLPLHLRASSLLQGVAINLPEPFSKAAQDTRHLQVDVQAQSASGSRVSTLAYHLRLQDQAQMAITSRGGKLSGVALNIGDAPPVVEPGAFRISGALPFVDLQEWNKTLNQYLAQTAADEVSEPGDTSRARDGLPIAIDLVLGQVQLGPLTYDHVALTGGREHERWRFAVQSPDMVGTYRAGGDVPLQAQLSYLKVPHAPATGGVPIVDAVEPKGLAALDLQSLVPVDFYVKELVLGERALGEWQFNLRPVDGGVIAYNLQADVQGAKISGRRSSDGGAELVWLRSGIGDVTYFAGQVKTQDVSGLLASFGQEKVLTSDRAAFDLQLQWDGTPDEIALGKLLGIIDIELSRGRFIRGAEVGENPVVKLLGLLNFDTLARRLRLDFSDLNPEGLGYEQVRGTLAFKEGIIEINDPLQVDSPASHLQFVGEIDLLQQTVDAQLVTTFPLTGNLTMAAALTGVLPAAVGVFVVGKLFKEQIDKVSSIRYSINGSWSEPEVEVQKVFENQTNHQPARGQDQ